MAKNKSKKSSFKFEWSWKTVGIISLIINGLMIVGSLTIMMMYRDGSLDVALATTGRQSLCSDEFRTNIMNHMMSVGLDDKESKTATATIDYSCQREDARTYYDEGLDKYKHSLGL